MLCVGAVASGKTLLLKHLTEPDTTTRDTVTLPTVGVNMYQLERKTKGARRKIVTNIAKLRDRPRILAEMSAHLDREDCSVKKVIMELEIMIKSPVKIGGERRERWRHDSGR